MDDTLKGLEIIQNTYGRDAALIAAENLNLCMFTRAEFGADFFYRLHKRWSKLFDGEDHDNLLDPFSN